MTAILSSWASIDTDRPERWAKQLVSHLGRRNPVENTAGGDVLSVGGGQGFVGTKDGALLLRATAPDAESLSRVEDVLARHLERFAAREGLKVEWIR
ncbi:DUF2218 domain-containing protein [Arthrobacter sp. MW3 TE3886]|uniref:DUF2218 domain-containing protein n=1 Tax=Arthrobacter sp. MW3 TE3886 TaxID=3156254 RepID=UPI0035173D76